MKDRKPILEFQYPSELIDNLNQFPLYSVFPCSANFMKKNIGGLFLTCNKNDLPTFGLVPPNIPNPAHRFRMMNINQKNYAIEIQLIFSSEIMVRMHLNPISKSTKEFFNLIIQSKFISFHFYDAETPLLSSGATELEGEDMEWFKRNVKLINKLTFKNNYELVCNELMNEFKPRDFYFRFIENENTDCFIRPNKSVTKYAF
jgi:hypothetical protein